LEFALVCPVFIMFVFGFIVFGDLIQCHRAMDLGVERALRYAVVHGGGGTANVSSTYFKAASEIMTGVGTSGPASTVAVTPSNFTAGTLVTVTATYTWNPVANYSLTATPLFGSLTLTATGAMTVVQ
jgi:Flp pilus assembly protein TadG